MPADGLLALVTRLTVEGSRRPSKTVLRNQLLQILRPLKKEGRLEESLRLFLPLLELDRFLPESHRRFQYPMIEGLIYFLGHLPITRLADALAAQLALDPDTDQGRRLVTLIRHFPTLHKLVQVICRTPGLEPRLKQSLVDLEDNLQILTFGRLRATINRERRKVKGLVLRPQERILAEASVCAVVPAKIRIKAKNKYQASVLKVLKPSVKRQLGGELRLLDRVAQFLDNRKQQWQLGNFNFIATFQRIRSLLENEADLSTEQANLERIRIYYRDSASVHIPTAWPQSTPHMTIMSRIDGHKITDVEHLTDLQRRRLAETIAFYCIIKPIQDLSHLTYFHGDPHAGNLAYRFDKGRPELILYDWGMTGRLNRLERFGLICLVAALMTKHTAATFLAADLLTEGQLSSDGRIQEKAMELVETTIAQATQIPKQPLGQVEFLLEALTYEGIVFSKNLMLYEKALVTLKGVLHDVDPSFKRGDYLLGAAVAAYFNDMLRLRLAKILLADGYALYRNQLTRYLQFQKIFWTMAISLSRTTIQLPLHLLGMASRPRRP
jgi:ubiquinone biosynthesis protein